MNESNILLKAYYETLYNRLSLLKKQLSDRMNELLSMEIDKKYAGMLNKKKYEAYFDTCIAFLDERLEAYNPIGIQCLFDNAHSREVYELELQLNWYNSRQEFNDLLQCVHRKAGSNMTDDRISKFVDEIIREVGAFPDRSILSAYIDSPSIEKVPDFILAQAIEEMIIAYR